MKFKAGDIVQRQNAMFMGYVEVGTVVEADGGWPETKATWVVWTENGVFGVNQADRYSYSAAELRLHCHGF